MTLFIDLRANANGGVVAATAVAWDDGDVVVPPEEFARRVAGRDLLVVAHGFNVDRQDGLDALTMWSTQCALPASGLFVGVLWPGDAKFVPVIDYPIEGPVAIDAGRLLGTYLNQNASQAASLALASHSLGARVMLQALGTLERPCRRLILMAAAIENDCLSNEYATAAANAQEIFVLASKEDAVLEWAFPAGNLVGEILMRGHPYDRTALGRSGPARPIDVRQRGGCWQLPQAWDYGHLDYLPHGVIGAPFALPIAAPADAEPAPGSQPGWKPSWSAAAVTSQDR